MIPILARKEPNTKIVTLNFCVSPRVKTIRVKRKFLEANSASAVVRGRESRPEMKTNHEGEGIPSAQDNGSTRGRSGRRRLHENRELQGAPRKNDTRFRITRELQAITMPTRFFPTSFYFSKNRTYATNSSSVPCLANNPRQR